MIIVNWRSSKMRYNALKDLMLAGGAYRTFVCIEYQMFTLIVYYFMYQNTVL